MMCHFGYKQRFLKKNTVGPRAGTKNITHVFVLSQNPSKFLEIVVTRSSLIQRLGFDRMGIDGLWQWLGAQVVWMCEY
jgi:hypothetical protein